MSESLNPLSLRTDRPLEEWRVEILAAIDAAFKALNCQYMLVGATARDLLLYHVYGGSLPSRRTRDIDFAIVVASWEAFAGIRDALLAHAQFSATKAQHRLRYSSTIVPDAEIDVIPFGKIASPDGSITWPPEFDTVMSVAGFEEALSASVLIRITADLSVPTVSLPGLAILKLFAWSDRKEDRDATDLLRVIRSYADAGNEDRLYESSLAEEFGFDMDRAGAKLLGMDAAALCKPETLQRLIEIFAPDRIERLIHQAAPGRIEDSKSQTAELVNIFLKALSGLQ
jgi:predicted nucleotidyltransferase